jgi:hypothetical protein
LQLGGTWPDGRNPSSWNQENAAQFLAGIGYKLFLMGKPGLLTVDANFFKESRVYDEGFGHFVQGNLLAVHKSVLR